MITRHFTIDEFALPPPGRALRAGHEPGPYPAKWVAGRLRLLCEALEVLRAELGGRPLRITSGFRTVAYNGAIGGARRSQHVEGRAADIVVEGVRAATVHDTALQLVRAGRLRIGGLGRYPGFTHVDVRNVRPKGPPPRLVRWSGTRRDNLETLGRL